MKKCFALMLLGIGSVYGEGFYAEGSFLYWSARFQNISYVALAHSVGTTGDRQIVVSKSFRYPYDLGFKLGAGYKFPCRGWDLFVNWTHLHTYPYENVYATSKNQLSPVSDFDMIGAEASHVRGSILFNAIDVELGQDFCVNRWLSLRPFVGFKSILLRHHFKGHLVNPTSQSEIVTDYTSNLHDHPWGIGPRIGLDTKWYITPHFTFLFNGAGALLWENFYTVGASTFLGNGDPHGGATINNVQGILPVGELFTGLGYEGCLTRGLFLEAQVGYEMQLLMGQIPAGGIGSTPEARLGLHGLTASLRLKF